VQDVQGAVAPGDQQGFAVGGLLDCGGLVGHRLDFLDFAPVVVPQLDFAHLAVLAVFGSAHDG